ncbi:hypothetical protein, partial [Mycobacterium kiyosense]
MAGQARSHDEAKIGGVFDRVGDFVIKWPWLAVGGWIAVVAFLALTFPPLQVQAAKHEQKPLPDNAPTMIAQAEMNAAFAARPGGSEGSGGPAGSSGSAGPGG